jgi:hypothetical protein
VIAQALIRGQADAIRVSPQVADPVP